MLSSFVINCCILAIISIFTINFFDHEISYFFRQRGYLNCTLRYNCFFNFFHPIIIKNYVLSKWLYKVDHMFSLFTLQNKIQSTKILLYVSLISLFMPKAYQGINYLIRIPLLLFLISYFLFFALTALIRTSTPMQHVVVPVIVFLYLLNATQIYSKTTNIVLAFLIALDIMLSILAAVFVNVRHQKERGLLHTLLLIFLFCLGLYLIFFNVGISLEKFERNIILPCGINTPQDNLSLLHPISSLNIFLSMIISVIKLSNFIFMHGLIDLTNPIEVGTIFRTNLQDSTFNKISAILVLGYFFTTVYTATLSVFLISDSVRRSR